MPIFDVFPTQIPVLASVLPPEEITSADWFYTVERSISIAIRASDAAQGFEVAYPSPFGADKAFSVETCISQGTSDGDAAYGVETVGDRVIACEDIVSAVERAFIHLFSVDFIYMPKYELAFVYPYAYDFASLYEVAFVAPFTHDFASLKDIVKFFEFTSSDVAEMVEEGFASPSSHDIASLYELEFPRLFAYDSASLVEQIGDRTLALIDSASLAEIITERFFTLTDMTFSAEAYILSALITAEDISQGIDRLFTTPHAADVAYLSEVLGDRTLSMRDEVFLTEVSVISSLITAADAFLEIERAYIMPHAADVAHPFEYLGGRAVSAEEKAFLTEVSVASALLTDEDCFLGAERAYIMPYAADVAHLSEFLGDRTFGGIDFASLTELLGDRTFSAAEVAYPIETKVLMAFLTAEDAFFGVELAYPMPYVVDVAHLSEVLGDRVFSRVDVASITELLGDREFSAAEAGLPIEASIISAFLTGKDEFWGVERAYIMPFTADIAHLSEYLGDRDFCMVDIASITEVLGDRALSAIDETFITEVSIITAFLTAEDGFFGIEREYIMPYTVDIAHLIERLGDRTLTLPDAAFLTEESILTALLTVQDGIHVVEWAYIMPYTADMAHLVEYLGDRIFVRDDLASIIEVLGSRLLSTTDTALPAEAGIITVLLRDVDDFYGIERAYIMPYTADIAHLSEVLGDRVFSRVDVASIREILGDRVLSIADAAFLSEVGIITAYLAVRDAAHLSEVLGDRAFSTTDIAFLTEITPFAVRKFAADSFYGIERAYIMPYVVDVAHLSEVLGDRIFTGADFASVFELLGGRTFSAFAAFYGIDRLIQEIKEGRLFTLMFAFNAFAYASVYTTASYTPPIACEAHLSVDTAKDTDAILALFVSDEEEKHPKDAFSSQVLFYGGALPEFYKGLFAWSFRDDSYVERDTDFDGVQAEFSVRGNYVMRILQTADKTIYEVFDEARNLICKKEYNKGFSNPMRLVISTCTHTDYAFYQIYRMKFAFLRKLIFPEPTVTIGEEYELP